MRKYGMFDSLVGCSLLIIKPSSSKVRILNNFDAQSQSITVYVECTGLHKDTDSVHDTFGVCYYFTQTALAYGPHCSSTNWCS